jgi:Ca-activated chloride channel family protein
MNLKHIRNAFLFLLFCHNATLAQSGRKPAAEPRTVTARSDTLRFKTVEVELSVTVRDSLGQAVIGLQPADFAIYDDGKRYEPLRCEYRHLPANVLVLLDGSARLFEDEERVRQALLAFHRELAAEDRVAVLQFTDELLLTQGFRHDEAAFAKALRPALRRNGKAALTDALLLAAAKLSETPGQRVILLFTSGFNTAALTDISQALHAVQSVGAAVYVYSQTETLAVALRQTVANDAAVVQFAQMLLARAERDLTTLADLSGGNIFFPLHEKSLAWMLAETAAELRGQYWLSYMPEEDLEQDARLHRLQVVVRGGHQSLTRTGPHWPAQPLPGARTPLLSVSKKR